MARSFTAASSQYLGNAAAVLTAPPITMACWFKANGAAADYTLMSLSATGASNSIQLRLAGTQGGDPLRAFTLAAAVEQSASTTTGFSTGVWQHGAAVFASSSDRRAYLDGGNKGTNAVSNIPTGIALTGVGALNRTSPSNFHDGLIAEAAIWNVALDDAEVASLAAGFCPMLIRPTALVAYWPLIGRHSPEIDPKGRFDLTLNGAPPVADHPRIIYAVRPHVAIVASGGITATVNQVSETYLAQPVTHLKQKAIGQNTETDLAQPLSSRKTVTLALNSEADTAQPVTHRKSKTIGQSTETDLAQALTHRKIVTIGQNQETDLAQPVTRAGATPTVNQVTETDAAQPVSHRKTKSIGQASETDLAQPLATVKRRAIGQTSEVDSAFAIAHSKTIVVAQTAEIDLAQPVTWRAVRLVGQALEVDFAQPITVQGGPPSIAEVCTVGQYVDTVTTTGQYVDWVETFGFVSRC